MDPQRTMRTMTERQDDAAPRGGAGAPARRPPGRPALMTREQVLERIRELSRRPDGLFRVHRAHPAVYARARRMFGSWSAAVAAAGIDYVVLVSAARTRSVRARRGRSRRPPGSRG